MSMRRIVTHYKIATGDSLTTLETKVKKEIETGWQPIGGVTIIPNEIWVQALVWKRYEAPPTGEA